MRRILPWMVVITAAALPELVAAMEPKTSELQSGRWIEVAEPTTQRATDPALVQIEQLLRDRKFDVARKQSIAWLKTHKSAPDRDRALYLMAEALFQYGDRIKSFYYLDELMDEYPESSLYYRALEKQYTIADAYLNGYKRRFLKIPMFGAEDEAIEMLFRVRERSPGSPLAEKALIRTADYYYASRQFDLATDAYAAYARNYPRSPLTPRVKLRQAYANLAQFRGVKFDATPVVDAKAILQEVAATYPELAAEENIAGLLERIDGTFAKKLAVTADFYKRTHEPRAAAYTERYLAQTFPDTVEGQRAAQRVAPVPSQP